MFYETAQTVGPGWHSRSYKPAHYEDMTWSPSSRNFRSPGSSPETYRRIIHPEDDFPSSRTKGTADDDYQFFSGRRSPTFPRRIFKEVWDDSPTSNHRFGDRPRMFKRVFKPNRWDDEFERDAPSVRRVEREFDKDFDSGRFSSPRDLQKDIEEEFEKATGRVHHIPIMVERRMEEMKSRFGRASPPPASERAATDDVSEEWVGPQVQRLRKNFEPEDDDFSTLYNRHRVPRVDVNSKPRAYTSIPSDTWDPHSVHTLPTRKPHKSSQSFDDSKHTVPPKAVFRSYSETHEDVPRQQPQHSAAFRSHSDGHCPKQTYVTKIEVNLPSDKEKEVLRSKNTQSKHEDDAKAEQRTPKQPESPSEPKLPDDLKEEPSAKPKTRNYKTGENAYLQQIAAVLQNVEDLVVRVEAYSGAGRDKQYRFLDEMLTRCMLRLDDVDTEGREDIRSARKAAVRQVQSCIEKLEVKANESERKKSTEHPQNNYVENDGSGDKEEKKETEDGHEESAYGETPPSTGDNEQTKL